MVGNFVIPQIQQRQCLDSITFMQNGGSPHIEFCVQQFTNERVISRAFPKIWPPRSLDLNSRDFWLCGYIKNLFYRGSLVTLGDLKDSITLHVRNISNDQLRSAIEQAVHRLQILQLEEWNCIEQLSLHR